MLSKSLFVMLPVLLFYLMEAYEHNPFADVRPKAQLLNAVLFELLAWLLLFLTGQARTAVRLLGLLAMLFGLTNHYVMEFRSTPFVPWDLLSVRTAASVADNYNFTPNIRVVLVTAGFAAIGAGVHFLDLKTERGLKVRLLFAAAAAMVLFLFSGRLQDAAFQSKNGLYPFLFTPAHMTKVNGMAVTFVMDMAYLSVDKPKGYDKAQAAGLLEQYGYESFGDGNSGAKNPSEKAAEYPNVIVIMDEAFSDLGVLGEVRASEDYMPFVHELMGGAADVVSGYLYVSVCGGNTANTEYEFLTGNSMAELPEGSIPYQQYIRGEKPSVAAYLKSLGYQTVAMHPYNSTGWERNRVYPWLGFEQSLFLKDMKDVQKLRTYASDAYDFAQVIRLYEEKEEGRPLFLFNVTMQNHGSYGQTYDNFTPDITVEGVNSVALRQYLSLIKRTDEDFKNLLAYFDAQEERTVIVFFGDHQPANAVAKYIAAEDTPEEDRYKVPYLIWANYDIPEAAGEDISANYLAARALEAAGVPNSGYQQFLLDLKSHYPVYAVGKKTESSPMPDMLSDYRKLQYYRLFDWEETE